MTEAERTSAIAIIGELLAHPDSLQFFMCQGSGCAIESRAKMNRFELFVWCERKLRGWEDDVNENRVGQDDLRLP